MFKSQYIVQYVIYMRGPGEVAPFGPFKIHYCSRPLLNPNKNLSVADSKKISICLANFNY